MVVKQLLHGFPNQMELVTLDPSAQKNALYSCHLQSPISPAAELHKCQSLQRESQSLQERRPPRYRPGRLRPVLLWSCYCYRGTEFPFLSFSCKPSNGQFCETTRKNWRHGENYEVDWLLYGIVQATFACTSVPRTRILANLGASRMAF